MIQIPIQLPLLKERTLLFSVDVNQTSIGELTKKILEIQEQDEYIKKIYGVHDLVYTPAPIKIYIDSHGGAAYQMLGLLGVIENSKIPIHTIVTGIAASAGFLIATTGHKRFAYATSTFMYHQIASHKVGKLKDQEENILESKRLQRIVEAHTLRHTKITKARIKEVYDQKFDWYMSAIEALKYGVIDEIL